MARLEMVNPVGEPPAGISRLAPVPDTVNGKTAGFRIQWPKFDVFMGRFGELLRERKAPKGILTLDQDLDNPVKSVAGNRAAGDKKIAEWAERVDYAVLGLAA